MIGLPNVEPMTLQFGGKKRGRPTKKVKGKKSRAKGKKSRAKGRKRKTTRRRKH